MAWALAGICLLLTCCFWTSIRISISVIKAASSYVWKNMHIVIVPFLSFVFSLLFIAAWIASAVFLYSCGDFGKASGGGLIKEVHWSDTTRYLMIYQLFGLLWVVALTLACTSFVIICSVSMWYFSHNSDTKATSSIMTGIGWVFRYHLGSLAFGSFIIALIWFVRLIFEYLEKKMKMEGGAANNPLVSCLICCFKCCLDCCNRFVKYINKNAYCQVVLASTNFCTSAINSFTLMLKHAATFAISGGVTNVIMFLGKMLISIITAIIGYEILTNWTYISNDIMEPLAPCVVFFLTAYLISSAYMSIFSTSVVAILQCFLVDVDVTQKTRAQDLIDGHNRPEELEDMVRALQKD